MLKAKFKYNPNTLRFERVKISVFNILSSLIGYLTFGALFFIGLLFLQNLIVETPTETTLRNENEALHQHQVVLAGLIDQSNEKIQKLQDEDLDLYQKLFETREISEQESKGGQEKILTASGKEFDEYLQRTTSQFTQIYESAKLTNIYFHNEASVKKEDLSTLFKVPSIVPVENFDLSKMVSGYGTRINPFHKGNYHHDGVDIASPRGTAVLAAGPGMVVVAKRSDLLAGYGNYVEIDHGNGYITRYSHLEEIVVNNGQKITKGKRLGTVGSTGGSVAPHVHYEVIKDGLSIDPVKFFAEGISADLYRGVLEKSKKQNQSLD